MGDLVVLLAVVGEFAWTSDVTVLGSQASWGEAFAWCVHTTDCIRLARSRRLSWIKQARHILLESLQFHIIWCRWHVKLIVIVKVPIRSVLLSLNSSLVLTLLFLVIVATL